MTQRPSTRMGWRASESHGMGFIAAIETGATRHVVRTSDRHVARVAGRDWSHAKGSAAERLARCRLTRHTQDEESEDGHESTNETYGARPGPSGRALARAKGSARCARLMLAAGLPPSVWGADHSPARSCAQVRARTRRHLLTIELLECALERAFPCTKVIVTRFAPSD